MNKKGSYSLEALFVFPVILMMLIFVAELGFLMYDWAVVNYTVSSTAALAAKEGTFSTAARTSMQNYLKQWTTSGKALTYVNVSGTTYTPSPTQAIIYGTPSSSYVQYGGTITVGICFPYKFKTFTVNALSKWFIQNNQMYLRVQSSAISEVYRE